MVEGLDEDRWSIRDERQEAHEELHKVLDKLFRLGLLHPIELCDQEARQQRLQRRTAGEKDKERKKKKGHPKNERRHSSRTRACPRRSPTRAQCRNYHRRG